MPLIYSFSLATPGNLTTSATPSTETDAISIKAGVRNALLQGLRFGGANVAVTQLNSMQMRLAKLGTASTGGTGMTPSPVDAGAQAAKATVLSRPTIGTTRTNRMVYTCSSTNGGGFEYTDPDMMEQLEGSAANSIDAIDISGVASFIYAFSGLLRE